MELIENLKESFLNQFKNTANNGDILICCLIDSRTKKFIEKSLVGFTENEYNAAKDKLKNLLLEQKDYGYQNEMAIEIGGKFDSERVETLVENEFQRWIISKENISTALGYI